MPVQTPSLLLKQTSDAEFRAWGKGISDALTAIGIPKTADTGQVDWTAVTKPAAINTAQGYEIRRFDDALQATAPIFFKLEFGSGSATTNPAIWLTIGTATDGAGTLTGLLVARRQLLVVAAAGALTTRICGDTNRVILAGNSDATGATTSFWFGIERTHDAAGADTDEGLLYFSSFNAVTNIRVGAYLFGTGVIGEETTFGALLPSVGAGANGSAVALYPIFVSKGVYFNPFLNVLIAFASNVSTGVQLSFTYYGATRAFLPVENVAIVSGVRGSVAGTCLLMRDE